MKFKDKLKELEACSDVIEWVGNKGLKKAWDTCDRADWMFWLAAKMIGKKGWSTQQEIVLTACWCVRRAQKYWTDKTDTRPIDAIEAAERWAKNPIDENRDAARAAARAAALAADDAALAADDAAGVAWAARAAVWAAWAAWAAGAAAWAARAAAEDAAEDARAAEHKIMCDYICKTLKIGRME